jgi:hypothetical protein
MTAIDWNFAMIEIKTCRGSCGLDKYSQFLDLDYSELSIFKNVFEQGRE